MPSFETDEEYRNEFLNFFQITEYNNDVIMEKVSKLYDRIKDIHVFQERMREGANRAMTEDLELGLVMMFSFDYFKDFCQLLENHQIKLSD